MRARERLVRFEVTSDVTHPFRVSGWRNVGGIYVGDKFTEEVAEVLVEAFRSDGITVVVEEVQHAK